MFDGPNQTCSNQFPPLLRHEIHESYQWSRFDSIGQPSLSLAHNTTAHQGPKKMLARIKPHYWWPKQKKTEIENYVKSCKRCGATLAQGYRNAPIHQRPREVKQFALREVDLKGPLPRTKEDYDNMVVIADPTTKYVEMHLIRGQTSEVVCRVLKGWISCYGLPKKLHSNNRPCFVTTSFKQFCADHSIEHTLSPPYHPQANMGVEKINRTVEALTKLVNKHPKKWSENLPDIQLAYNSAEHASTGTLPYELVYKENPRSKFEMFTEKISPGSVRLNHLQ